MQMGHVNYLSVLVSAAAYWILGALWFNKALFGKQWMKGIGKTEEQVKADFKPMSFLWSFVWSFIAAYGIARILVWIGENTVGDGVLVAVLAGVCFILAPAVINNLFERRSCTLLCINVGYHAVGLIISGVIIAAW